MNIIQTGDCQIKKFEGFGQDNSLIHIARTTCYKSEDTTKLDKDSGTKSLIKNKHFAMLEFSYFPVKISNVRDDVDYENIMSSIFCFQQETNRNNLWAKSSIDSNGSSCIIIYGNGRVWLEYINWFIKSVSNNKETERVWQIFSGILNTLKNENSIMFDFFVGKITDDFEYTLLKNNDEIPDDDFKWYGFKLSDISIGFTREINRHRSAPLSIAEMSTRYVDCNFFNFIFDKEELKNNDDLMILEHSLGITMSAYHLFKKQGYTNDIIRQILPIGMSTEICYSAPLFGWKEIFRKRLEEKGAHKEAKIVIGKIQDLVGLQG